MTENGENESVIEFSGNQDGIPLESKYWEDLEEFGEKQLLNSKITKVKIYSGKFKGKDVILGIDFTYQNLFNGKEKVAEHKGSDEFNDVKELVIKEGEYLMIFILDLKMMLHIFLNQDTQQMNKIQYQQEIKKEKIRIFTQMEEKILQLVALEQFLRNQMQLEFYL